MASANSFKALNPTKFLYMSIICTRKINNVFKVTHPVAHHQLIDGWNNTVDKTKHGSIH